jgi:hypothetical protein
MGLSLGKPPLDPAIWREPRSNGLALRYAGIDVAMSSAPTEVTGGDGEYCPEMRLVDLAASVGMAHALTSRRREPDPRAL